MRPIRKATGFLLVSHLTRHVVEPNIFSRILFSRFFYAYLWFGLSVLAQTPTGTIYGNVYDPSRAIVTKCQVTISNTGTGWARELICSESGTYTFTALVPGNYLLRFAAPGFKTSVSEVTVNAGSSTLEDMDLEIGAQSETVTVLSSNSDVRSKTSELEGSVSRFQIDFLPLNGRSFLQLAALEPGVAVTPAYPGLFNRQFDVSILGGDALHTMITVDGASIWDPTTGGAGMNLSQEVVQEFQLSSANFDPSTGFTAYGAVNIVTRGGGNSFHGAGYFYYRDHNMAAYPGLARTPLAPDPFFARRQSGASSSGPIRKNRLFFFANFEANLQNSVYVVEPNSPLLAGFAEVAPSPLRAQQVTTRFDYRLSNMHSLMVRYSHDGNHVAAPPATAVVSPSDWEVNRNWSDQGLLALTSVLSPSLVNDFRVSFWYWMNRNVGITRDECTASCVGFGLPEIQVLGTNFTVGQTQNAPQGRFTRIWGYQDSLTWNRGGHQLRFGAEFTHENVSGYWDLADPGVITVYSPDYLAQLGLLGNYGLTGGLQTTADILSLPLYSFITGVGDPTQPQPYDRSAARVNNRIHVFAQDRWRIKPNLTINYSLGWSYESNLLNYDLPKPQYLAPILGPAGLGPSQHNYHDFSPSVGLAWRLSQDSKTVLLAGAGIYYDTQLLWLRGEEPSYIGPFPNGHVVLTGGAIPNPIPGIAGAPVGAPIQYTDGPSGVTAGMLVQLLPGLRSALSQEFGVSGTNLALPAIDYSKSAFGLLPTRVPTPYSENISAGVSRQGPAEIQFSGTFVFRQYMHTMFDDTNAPDYNHFYAASGPVIPLCTPAQVADPAALCSTGPITVWTPGGRGHYIGLLANAEKRLSHRLEFTAAYALASQMGFDASNGFANLNNWFANYGPLGPRHSLTTSGVLRLPWRLDLSTISTVASRRPVMPYISNIDLSGSGTTYSLLPGASFNCFNRGCGSADLIRLVNEFNRVWAGKTTPAGQLIPHIDLPSHFSLGDGVSSQDFRLARSFGREHMEFRVFAELFNAFNFANRTAYNWDLNSPGFGQPTQRLGQTFGSGGSRALQLGARLTF